MHEYSESVCKSELLCKKSNEVKSVRSIMPNKCNKKGKGYAKKTTFFCDDCPGKATITMLSYIPHRKKVLSVVHL